ncbi:S-layer homology domain-containing protein [Cyanobacteria bacterium FACHB-DQ100]|nr:S-layer homology domain-containing protein [Cyanobacteria bacterium FACHB-DQ100]MBD2080231.1 S-layer homology domain-containing protein [Leptolyngbya sp. FACHB-17]
MRNGAIVGIGITATSAALLSSIFAPSTAQNTNFRDTQNYWAKPFIEALASRNVIKGYPDGTFRPDQPVDRDEFAAILRTAFNQPQERQIGSGSDYRDVPKGYWAAPAIKEAYEAGFMRGYPGGNFRPNQPVTKVEALVSLAQNLNLNSKVPATNQAAIAQNTNTQPVNNQAASQRRANRGLMFPFPMASMMLLQPFVTPAANRVAAALPAQSPTQSTAASAAKASTPRKQPSLSLNQYYTDANRIPKYAVGPVAEATRSNIVVNHPNARQLNPLRPATRGEVAAIVYQAMVNKGYAQPISQNVPASKYVVRAEKANQPR